MGKRWQLFVQQIILLIYPHKMINIVITSYNEPKSTLRALNTFLNQKTKHNIKVYVIDPFPEVEKFLKSKVKDERFEFILDPGEGKSYALNMLLSLIYSKNKKDIIIFTDGDVYTSDNSINQIYSAFLDEKIGCICARPISLDSRKNKYGYFAHVAFNGIDKVRRNYSNKNKFFECSGYCFAIRNGVIKEFPLDVSEDSIIPYMFWEKNFLIKYLPQVEVYIKNPDNKKDYLNQKIRNIKGHENLNKIAPKMPRTKSFFNEIKYGFLFSLSQIRNVREFLWTFQFIYLRLYIYLRAFRELKSKKNYTDGWRETEINSTKPLD